MSRSDPISNKIGERSGPGRRQSRLKALVDGGGVLTKSWGLQVRADRNVESAGADKSSLMSVSLTDLSLFGVAHDMELVNQDVVADDNPIVLLKH